MRQVSFSETNYLSLHLVSSRNTSSPLVLHIYPLFLVLSCHYVSRCCAGSLSASLVRWDEYHSLRQPFEKLGCWIHLHSFLFLREKLQVVCLLLTMQSHVTTSHPHTLTCFLQSPGIQLIQVPSGLQMSQNRNQSLHLSSLSESWSIRCMLHFSFFLTGESL